MSESKFTPGPWQAIASIPEEGFEAFLIKAQPNQFMRGFTREIGNVNGPQSIEQAANARLIAAAPDMYEALSGLISAVEKDATTSRGISGFTGARLSDARAALLKAQPDSEKAQVRG